MHVVVIGAGPAGLITAREAAKRGTKVTVYEEHSRIGKPVQCAGLVSRKGLDFIDVDYDEAVLNWVNRARIFSPDGNYVELEKPRKYAAVLDRAAFDRVLAEEAVCAGAELIPGKRILPVDVRSLARQSPVIGADGPTSIVASSLGLRRDYIVAYQVENVMRADMDTVELHFGSFAPGFFAWIIPVDEKLCRVGLGYNPSIARVVHRRYDPRSALRFFVRIHDLPWRPRSELGGMIPLYDGRRTVYGNIALVGDAAGQVKASTGGGVAIGGGCAKLLGTTIGEGKTLSDYENLWRRKFERELVIHRGLHELYKDMTDKEFNYLMGLVHEDRDLLRILEERGEMEEVSGVLGAIVGYFAKNPIKTAKLFPFARKLGNRWVSKGIYMLK